MQNFGMTSVYHHFAGLLIYENNQRLLGLCLFFGLGMFLQSLCTGCTVVRSVRKMWLFFILTIHYNHCQVDRCCTFRDVTALQVREHGAQKGNSKPESQVSNQELQVEG